MLSGNPQKKNTFSVVTRTYQVDKDHRLYGLGLGQYSRTVKIGWGHSILRYRLGSVFIRHEIVKKKP